MNMITPYDLRNINVHKILIYLRKSRSEGKETIAEVLMRHEKILQDFAIETFGERIPDHNVYKEVVSGETLSEREQIKKVFQRIEEDEIDGLLVIEPQRISRGDMSDCGRVVNTLKYSETLVVTITKTYDLNNKFDKELFESQLLQGNKYLEYQKEIMERGRQLSLREGKFLGSIAPYGYMRDRMSKGFKLTKDPEEAPIVEMIFDMALKENKSSSEIASYINAMGVTTRNNARWTYQTVTSILKHEAYYGFNRWGRRPTIRKSVNGEIQKVKITRKAGTYTLTKGLQEPFISKADWDILQERMKNSVTNSGNTDRNMRNPFRGLIYCAKCGYSIMMMHNAPAKSRGRKRLRKYELDKVGINKMLRDAREKKPIFFSKMSEDLGIQKHVLVSWFSPNIKSVHYSEQFTRTWPDLKLYLNIKNNDFDESIIAAVNPPEPDKILRCKTMDCPSRLSMYSKIEKLILDDLRKVLEEFKYYVDNYEEEIVKERRNVDKSTAKMKKKLEGLKKERKDLLRAWNRKEYEYDDYMELKTDIENEIQMVEDDIAVLEESEKHDKLIKYKKVVPKLEECLNEYDNMTVSQKNEILKSIIDKVEYYKTTSLHSSSTGVDNTKITTYLKI